MKFKKGIFNAIIKLIKESYPFAIHTFLKEKIENIQINSPTKRGTTLESQNTLPQ